MVYRKSGHGLECPRCATALAPDRTGGFHLCRQCGGLWLHAGVFDRVTTRPAPPRHWLWWRRNRAVCPACAQPLRAILCHDLALDECADHGLWFDGGELARLLAAAESGDPSAELTSDQLLEHIRRAVTGAAPPADSGDEPPRG